MRRTDAREACGFVPRIPLVVIGALRAGGSGKTSVTLQLARDLAARGLRPAILVYRLGSGTSAAPGLPGEDPVEVRADGDWRETSDEAVLLRRESGMRVFATRHRARAWRRLHETRFQADGAFDILLSDDGFQDPRLRGALRLLLEVPGERPGLFQLLPGGPFRETWKAAARADLRLYGPLFKPPSAAPFAAPFAAQYEPQNAPPSAHVTLQLPCDPAAEASGPAPEGDLPAAFPFHRRLIPPAGFDPARPWIVFCALGDNGPFLRDLERAGVRPAAVIEGRDHAAPDLKKLQAAAARHPGAGILCTRKDFLKLEAAGAGLPLVPMGQELYLDPEIPAAVAAWRLLSANRYLVHYPG